MVESCQEPEAPEDILRLCAFTLWEESGARQCCCDGMCVAAIRAQVFFGVCPTVGRNETANTRQDDQTLENRERNIFGATAQVLEAVTHHDFAPSQLGYPKKQGAASSKDSVSQWVESHAEHNSSRIEGCWARSVAATETW